MVVLVAVLVCRERPGERLLPWSGGEASPISVAAHCGTWGTVFGVSFKAMLKRESLLLAGAMVAFGVAWGVSLGALPLLATQAAAMTQEQYSALSGTSKLAAGMLGLLLFGVVADLVGPLRLLRFAFALAALLAAAMLLMMDSWASPWPVTLFTVGVMVCRTMAMVPNGALAMGLCVPAVAATQMTLFNASGNLGMSIGTALLGTLDRMGGHPAMVASMLVFSLVALALVLAKRQDARAEGREPLADAA